MTCWVQGTARPAGPAAPGSVYVWARMCRGLDGHPGLCLGGAVPFVLSDLQDSEATAHAFPLFFFSFIFPLPFIKVGWWVESGGG